MPVATGATQGEMVAAFGGSEDAGGDARAPSLGPRSPIGVGDRLRGDYDSSPPSRSGGYFQRNHGELSTPMFVNGRTWGSALPAAKD